MYCCKLLLVLFVFIPGRYLQTRRIQNIFISSEEKAAAGLPWVPVTLQVYLCRQETKTQLHRVYTVYSFSEYSDMNDVLLPELFAQNGRVDNYCIRMSLFGMIIFCIKK